MSDDWSSRPDPTQPQRGGSPDRVPDLAAGATPDLAPSSLAGGRLADGSAEIDLDDSARAARAEALDALSRALGEVTLDHEAALDVAVRHACGLLGDACLVLASIDHGARGAIVQPIAVHADGETRRALLDALRSPPLRPTEPLARRLLASAGPLFAGAGTDDIAAHLCERAPAVRDVGLHSLLAVPLHAAGRQLGSLLLARHTTLRPYDRRDLALAQALADRTAPALHAARIYEESLRDAALLRRDNRDLERQIAERTAEIELATAEIERIKIDDALTGLANRRHFDEVLERECRRAQRDGSYLTLLLFDLDHFQRYNARHGRMAGDACLRAVGGVLRNCFRRAADVTARYGGEEFAVILPGCPPATARATAERARGAVSGARAADDIPRAGGITVSVGAISAHVTGEAGARWFVERATDALARSKAAGRNCVVVSVDPSASR